MVVSYKIANGSTETQKGLVIIGNEDKMLIMKHMHSIKNATSQYLEQYNENIKALSKKVIDKIITEL